MRRLVVAAGTLTTGSMRLEGADAHYAKDVLRLKVGAEVWLYDGAGLRAVAQVQALTRHQVQLQVAELEELPPAPPPAVTLLQALGKGEKMDTVVRQATELGVARIVPVHTERSVPRGEGRVERWRNIAEDAVRVSGRGHRPVIDEVRPLAEILASPRAERALVLALEQGEDLAQALGAAEPIPRTIEVLIGPEGGLEPEEVETASKAGFLRAHLGPYTLRTETAGPALLAMIRFWASSFG